MKPRSGAVSWRDNSCRARPSSARRSPGKSSASLRGRRSPGSAMRSAPACTSRTSRARPTASTSSCEPACLRSLCSEPFGRPLTASTGTRRFSDVRTLEQIVDQSMLGNRVESTLLTFFASVALLLAAVGVYGVISYTAAQRTHEMGIRAALGASASNLRKLIFQEGLRLTAIGLLIGLMGTITRDSTSCRRCSTASAPSDPLTIAAVAAVLAGVAGLACFVPAWRITKADPMEALRYQ